MHTESNLPTSPDGLKTLLIYQHLPNSLANSISASRNGLLRKCKLKRKRKRSQKKKRSQKRKRNQRKINQKRKKRKKKNQKRQRNLRKINQRKKRSQKMKKNQRKKRSQRMRTKMNQYRRKKRTHQIFYHHQHSIYSILRHYSSTPKTEKIVANSSGNTMIHKVSQFIQQYIKKLKEKVKNYGLLQT